MPFRHDEAMPLGEGVDIQQAKLDIVLIDDVRGRAAGDDLTENARH